MRGIFEFQDTDGEVRPVLTEVDGIRLEGSCLKCGTCCHNRGAPPQTCEHLTVENLCAIHKKDKWWHCVVYPRDPYESLHSSCGFKWIKSE